MRGILKFTAWVVVILAIVSGISYALWLDAWTIPGDDPRVAPSLEPTTHTGDLVLIARDPGVRLGWLLRCADPQSGQFVVGRMIGNGGDNVVVDGEHVLLNGKHFSTPTACTNARVSVVNPANNDPLLLFCTTEEIGSTSREVLYTGESVEPRKEAQVSPGRIYLVSDDRHLHYDSRDFGEVDPATCQHVVFRLWGETGWSDASRRLTLLY